MFITSCASIVGETRYPVTFSSQPDGARITIQDENGVTVYNGNTPTTVTLGTKKGYFNGHTYKVSYSLPGYQPQVAFLEPGVSGWYLAGNIGFGGLIGWIIVDPLTGAMWKYPNTFNTNLSKNYKSGANEDGSLKIISMNDVPEEMRSQLIRIN